MLVVPRRLAAAPHHHRQGRSPGPADAFPKFLDIVGSGKFIEPLWATLVRTVLGFAGGFTLGVAYGIAAGRVRWFRHATWLVFLVFLFFNTLVLIFWGLAIFGNTSNMAAAVISSLAVAPTVGVYMRDVVLSMDDELLEMASAYRVSRWRRAIDVYLPFLTPAMLASARIGFSLAWKITLLAEVFGLPNGPRLADRAVVCRLPDRHRDGLGGGVHRDAPAGRADDPDRRATGGQMGLSHGSDLSETARLARSRSPPARAAHGPSSAARRCASSRSMGRRRPT